MRQLTISVSLLILVGCGGDAAPGGGTGTTPTQPVVPVPTEITLSPSNVTVTSLEETVAITATVTDQNGSTMAGQAVAWSSSNGDVATVTNGTVTPAANGSSTITATSGALSATASVIVVQSPADAGSSYRNSRTDVWIEFRNIPSGGFDMARAYLDADGDGDTDLFLGTGEWLSEDEIDSEMYINNGYGSFSLDQSVFGGSPPPATHARKSLTADFNGDGLNDVLILDHGYDATPFPGSNPKLVIQDSPGSFSWSRLPDKGFHHGGAAGDIDNDGDIDIFVAEWFPFFYINDGSGVFTRDDTRIDSSIPTMFTAELIDVDMDGFIDLLVGGHEREGAETTIYWGSSTGSYRASEKTVLLAASPFGVVLDMDAEDIDRDGDRDLVLNRTRDGDDGDGLGFYVGRRTQLLLHDGNRGFTNGTGQIDNPGSDTDIWFPWIRLQDIDGDGDIDIVPDDKAVGYVYLNDGLGGFIRTPLPL